MSKGREKPSLFSLSRELVQQSELDSFSDELTGSSDRACAILGAAIVDQVLVFQLHGAMRELSRTEFLALFFDNRAILQTMSARIELSYVLKLNDQNEKTQLHAIRRIRNAFAHAVRPVTFETDLVRLECGKLSNNYLADDQAIKELPESRRLFIGICVGIFAHFHGNAEKPAHYGLTTKYLKSPDFSDEA
jgi:hypothetical protein